MRIVTYASDHAPAGAKWIARIRIMGAPVKGKSVEEWHPVIVQAETREAAFQKAQDWWDAELDKERKRQANAIAVGLRLKATRTVAGSSA